MVNRRVVALLSLLAVKLAAAEPVVPGFAVTPYATVPDPTALSFASDGTVYAGADASGSGGGSGDAVKIHRIGAGGAPVEEFGVAAIPKQVERAVIQYAHRLSRLSAQKKLDDALRQVFLAPAEPLRADTKTLRKGAHCPGDARGG